MKFLFFCLLIAVSANSFAQDQREPEVVFKGEGRIQMENGDVQEGYISYSYVNSTHVHIKTADEKTERIRRSEVKFFEIDDIYFEKISQGTGIVIGDDTEFAIRKTPENSKIKVYETINQGRIGSGSPAEYSTNRSVIVYFPDQKPKSINDLSLSPFHRRVSRLVADCPTLSKKISEKEDGYSIGLRTSPQARVEIYLRLADEYTNCNQ